MQKYIFFLNIGKITLQIVCKKSIFAVIVIDKYGYDVLMW